MTREASDRFLWLCGWKQETYFAHYAPTTPRKRWRNPEGKIRKAPDPMGNLQDALDCVPEGFVWQINSGGDEYSSAVITNLGDNGPHCGVADTPAQALCAAIRKEKDDG